MKIAVWHNLLTGGAKRALHMHVKGLHERGHTIHVYAPTTANRDYLPLTPYAATETFLHLPPRLQPQRGAGIPAGFFSEEAEARIAILNQMQQHVAECAERIKADGNDILFANSCQFTYNSGIGITDLPSVSYLQEPYRPFYEASPKLPWLLSAASTAHPRNPYKRAMERSRDLHLLHAIRLQAREELSWAQKFNRILCNSQFSRESILRAYNIDPKVCYLGIDSEAFSPVSSKKEGYVIGAGSIHPSKNIAAAIMAIGKIPTRNRPPLLWIGNFADDSYRQQLMSIADRNEVEFKCKTLVSDSELQLAMSKAACFLYTSHLEPFGLTPLEANACGTAVVAVGEGGVRETIIQGVNGFLTLDNNPNELGDLVCRFTENLEYAEEMGRQARQHVIKHWPVSKANDRLEQHLISITN